MFPNDVSAKSVSAKLCTNRKLHFCFMFLWTCCSCSPKTVGHFYKVVISDHFYEPSNKWTQWISQRIPRGSRDFPKIWAPPYCSVRLKGDKYQVPYWKHLYKIWSPGQPGARGFFGSLMYPAISCSMCRIASVVIWQLSGWHDRYHYMNYKIVTRYEQKYRVIFVLFDRSAPARLSSEFVLDFLKVYIQIIKPTICIIVLF